MARGYAKIYRKLWKDEAVQQMPPTDKLVRPIQPSRENGQRKTTKKANSAEVKRLKSLPYDQYLETDHWKKVRTEAVRRFGNRCAVCDTAAGDARLDVHHRTYDRLGCEAPEDVLPLCENCHQLFHDRQPGRAKS